MSETLTVYFASLTGSVLGAVSRTAGAIPKPPRAVSQEDVLVRGGFDDPNPSTGGNPVGPFFPGFLVPARELSTLVLAPDPGLFPNPLRFQVPAQTDVVQQVTRRVEGLNLTATSSSFQLTVTLSSATTQKEPVWILITGSAPIAPRIEVGSIDANSATGTLRLQPLADGSYNFLALVRGHRPLAQNIDVDL